MQESVRSFPLREGEAYVSFPVLLKHRRQCGKIPPDAHRHASRCENVGGVGRSPYSGQRQSSAGENQRDQSAERRPLRAAIHLFRRRNAERAGGGGAAHHGLCQCGKHRRSSGLHRSAGGRARKGAVSPERARRHVPACRRPQRAAVPQGMAPLRRPPGPGMPHGHPDKRRLRRAPKKGRRPQKLPGRTASHRTALIFRGIFVLLDAGGLSPAKEKRAKSTEKAGCPTCVPLLIDACLSQKRKRSV